MTKEDFNKLSITKRYKVLVDIGDFVIARNRNEFQISLFVVSGFYVELWKRILLDEIVWVEVVNSQQSLDAYLSGIKLPN